jgi:inner membrane protein
MAQALPRLAGTTTGKLVLMAALTLLLLIPLGMIRDLVAEREETRDLARAEIARAWGGPQTIGGPILAVPVNEPASLGGNRPGSAVFQDELYFLPAELTIEGGAVTQVLKRGIFELPVYTASLSISGSLRAPDLAGFDGAPLEAIWGEAVLALPISDARSIGAPVRIEIDGAAAELEPGGTRVPGFGNQLVVRLAELGLETIAAESTFTIQIQIGGAESLRFLPVGDATTVTLSSNWPQPSFQGDYLPAERSVDDAGFTATWRVLRLGRGYPSAWSRSATLVGSQSLPSATNVAAASFGVDLMPPLTVHAANLKASKYGILFVGLTFIAFFLFEVFKRLRLHPVQYLSVGIANVLFYLLLLAISEHFGFGLAYTLSALASTALIGGYAAAVLGSAGRALPIAAMLGGTYLQLYMILNAEDYAVLIGALTLFSLLAAFMYLTRHVDWYALDPKSALDAAPRATRGSS